MRRFSIRSLLTAVFYVATGCGCITSESDLVILTFVYANAFLLAMVIAIASIRSNATDGHLYAFGVSCLVFFLADTQTGYSLASFLADVYTDGKIPHFPKYSVSLPYASDTSTYTVYVPDTRYREAHVFRCMSIAALSIASTTSAGYIARRWFDSSVRKSG